MNNEITDQELEDEEMEKESQDDIQEDTTDMEEKLEALECAENAEKDKDINYELTRGVNLWKTS